jgi:hypothetical protein
MKEQLTIAWLAGATFLLTTATGAFLVGAILRVSGARWSIPIRRVHESIAGVLPLGVIAFAPLFRMLRVRDVIAILVVLGFEEWVRASSLAGKRRTVAIAAASLPITSLAYALFAFDVLMPRGWSSDAYGLYLLVNSFGAGLAATAIATAPLADRLHATAEHSSALGRLQLVAHCVWAYVAFSIYLLIWIADLPREITFFLLREHGGWEAMTILIPIARFVIPFLLLVPRAPKRHWWFVGAIGTLTLLVHAIECVWLVAPDFAAAPSPIHFLFVVVLAAFGLAVAALRFRRHDALPADPGMAEALAYEAS